MDDEDKKLYYDMPMPNFDVYLIDQEEDIRELMPADASKHEVELKALNNWRSMTDMQRCEFADESLLIKDIPVSEHAAFDAFFADTYEATETELKDKGRHAFRYEVMKAAVKKWTRLNAERKATYGAAAANLDEDGDQLIGDFDVFKWAVGRQLGNMTATEKDAFLAQRWTTMTDAQRNMFVDPVDDPRYHIFFDAQEDTKNAKWKRENGGRELSDDEFNDKMQLEWLQMEENAKDQYEPEADYDDDVTAEVPELLHYAFSYFVDKQFEKGLVKSEDSNEEVNKKVMAAWKALTNDQQQELVGELCLHNYKNKHRDYIVDLINRRKLAATEANIERFTIIAWNNQDDEERASYYYYGDQGKPDSDDDEEDEDDNVWAVDHDAVQNTAEYERILRHFISKGHTIDTAERKFFDRFSADERGAVERELTRRGDPDPAMNANDELRKLWEEMSPSRKVEYASRTRV
ncbi:hypothetical protein JKP88DRAFT_243837 [Tribonema minus]|uniref:Uncharacterized protein n=1 Tax=Tribonema minus TaxID=303371 RepID=A0A835ZE76_9STRA|nr:hypothetical protein JKP88DRAFT_243837 [Tribonema minus]